MDVSIHEAPKQKGIPPSSIRNHYIGKTRDRQKGPFLILSIEM